MQIQRISKYRKELMGIAILFIMFTHSTFVVDNSFVKGIYEALRWFTRIGVDLFFMLSGLGLYYSMKNNSDIGEFYKRRFKRLIPTYLIVTIGWAIVSIGMSWETLSSFVYRYSLVTFFTGAEYTSWFIAAIIVLYLVFPLLYAMALRRTGNLYALMIIIWMFSLTVSLTNTSDVLQGINNIFIVRIPSFLMGIVIAKQTENEKKLQISRHSLALSLLLVLLLANYKLNTVNIRCIERMLFMPISYCLLALLAGMMERRKEKRELTIFSFLGGVTLELYLLHDKVLYAYDYFITRCLMGSILSNITAVIISIIIAYLLMKAMTIFRRKSLE